MVIRHDVWRCDVKQLSLPSSWDGTFYSSFFDRLLIGHGHTYWLVAGTRTRRIFSVFWDCFLTTKDKRKEMDLYQLVHGSQLGYGREETDAWNYMITVYHPGQAAEMVFWVVLF
jgi:hypothetical protein